MSEPIKRYWAYPASHYEDSADGQLVLYTDHLATLESAKAEAFRQGQESMKKDANDVAFNHTCSGKKCCRDARCQFKIAHDIENIPLKEIPPFEFTGGGLPLDDGEDFYVSPWEDGIL